MLFAPLPLFSPLTQLWARARKSRPYPHVPIAHPIALTAGQDVAAKPPNRYCRRDAPPNPPTTPTSDPTCCCWPPNEVRGCVPSFSSHPLPMAFRPSTRLPVPAPRPAFPSICSYSLCTNETAAPAAHARPCNGGPGCRAQSGRPPPPQCRVCRVSGASSAPLSCQLSLHSDTQPYPISLPEVCNGAVLTVRPHPSALA